jgi:hypothetical protein
MKSLFLFLLLFSTVVLAQKEKFHEDELIFYFTTKISCVYKINGKYFEGGGTGFYFNFDTSRTTSIPVIVTNNHVIKNAISGEITFRIASKSGTPEMTTYALRLNNFEKYWIKHPDTSIDLCVLPLADIFRDLKKKQINIFFYPLTIKMIPSDAEWSEFFAIQSIKMVGYPNGLWDTINHLPILRTGVTATPIYYNYNGKNLFLIDSPCFPGSSGSPVLVYDVGLIQDRHALYPGNRTYLLGVMYAGPQMTVQGEIELVKGPIDKSAIVNTNIPINLGMVIKSNKLLDFKKILK